MKYDDGDAMDWRTRLARVLALVCYAAPAASRAAGVLRRTYHNRLKPLDRSLAHDSRMIARERGPVCLPLALPADPSRKDDDAFLFVHACSAFADVREHALTVFRAAPGSLAMGAALLRLDDRVAAVRQAAHELLTLLVREGHGVALFENLARVFSLRSRGKIPEALWSTTLEPALLDPRYKSQRLNATRRFFSHSDVRLFALQLAGKADPGNLHTLIADAAQDSDGRVASWALDHADLANPEAVLKLALANPLETIRSDAVRRSVALQLQPPNLRALLEGRLFDHARAPREAAAALLAEHHGIEAIDIWRVELDRAPSPLTLIALDAMRQRATHDDIDRLTRLLRHPRAGCRAAALAALAYASAPLLAEHLDDALGDPHRRVVRNAARCYAASPYRPAPARIAAAYVATVDVRVRRALIEAALLTGRWAALELLLAWMAQSGPGFAGHLSRQLDRWARAAVYRDEPLDDDVRTRIASVLESAREGHPANGFASVVDALRDAPPSRHCATPPSATP